MRSLARSILPERLLEYVRELRRRRTLANRPPPIAESVLRVILVERLGLRRGDIVLVHSSVDRLSLAFPFSRILSLLREIVGEEGTLLFPTFPKLASYEFLRTNQVFDVRKTPSYMGILSEYARRQQQAMRSLHPTKSVAALGPDAERLTCAHHESPFPYDADSPYARMIGPRGKVIGLGVGSYKMSFVHVVDDAMKQEFPVQPYLATLYHARCVDRAGREVIVPSYAHDPAKMKHDVPAFMRQHIDARVGEDLTSAGMEFFRADVEPLFERMLALARVGTTIYPRSVYRHTLREAL